MKTKNGVELYEKNGKIGVLVSYGFGAGWSTWYDDKRIAYDKRIIDFWLTHKDDAYFMNQVDSFGDTIEQEETTKFLEGLGYSGVYLGGFSDLRLKFVAPGIKWRITEYDGSETLETEEDADFISF